MENQLDLTNYPIWYTPFTQTWGFKIALFSAIMVLLVIILLLIFLFKKKKRTPYWEVYKRELILLEEEHDVKKVYEKLTEILKNYLKNRFQINLNNLTELEIIDSLGEAKIDFVYIDNLKNIFLIALQAKYNNRSDNEMFAPLDTLGANGSGKPFVVSETLVESNHIQKIFDFISNTEPRENKK